MERDRKQRHQATGGQIAVAPLSLDRRPVADLMVAHPGSGRDLQFPSAVDAMKET